MRPVAAPASCRVRPPLRVFLDPSGTTGAPPRSVGHETASFRFRGDRATRLLDCSRTAGPALRDRRVLPGQDLPLHVNARLPALVAVSSAARQSLAGAALDAATHSIKWLVRGPGCRSGFAPAARISICDTVVERRGRRLPGAGGVRGNRRSPCIAVSGIAARMRKSFRIGRFHRGLGCTVRVVHFETHSSALETKSVVISRAGA